MDRSWTKLKHKDRFSDQYKEGVKQFIEFAKKHAGGKDDAIISCPCNHCCNSMYKKVREVKDHLFQFGILERYTIWDRHGELRDDDDDSHIHGTDEMQDDHDSRDEAEANCNDVDVLMIEDLQRASASSAASLEETSGYSDPNICRQEAEKFHRLLNDGKSELYPGCEKYSKLSFIVKMLQIKIMTNISNTAFDMTLKLVKDALPEGETLPSDYYEVKKMMQDLGYSYVKIDACVNDCILFWNDFASLDKCPTCQASRWKNNPTKTRKTRTRVAQKVLRHFPLKPRLQRLFATKDIAKDMRWHKEERVDDDFIRHPADATSWKDFDKENSWFATDSRNVRLGLASDGFNPHGSMSLSYSMWPVFIVPYNLPPWKCAKEPFIFLSLLIPGRTSPGNNIDVYLQPLIQELRELWDEGIQTYDAFTKEFFKLHAALFWTINDFPAYGMLSGWSTKGKLACPVCNKDTCSITLKNGRKQSYMGHRMFLDPKHPWRRSKRFNGKPERRQQPKRLSGDDVLEQLAQLDPGMKFGKPANSRKRKRSQEELNWTKKSIFFDLPYWKSLKLRHNLDVMHIEKNIGENILSTLLNIEGKTKDDIKARYDLEAMGIRKELYVRQEGNRIVVPQACYTLTTEERKKFCEWMKSVKLPDGFGSNISRCVNYDEGKVSGLKSHDYHIFLQRLLPIAAQGFLQKKNVYTALSDLSNFFRELCSKTIHRAIIDKLKKEVVMILCNLEAIYPPSFFVVMVHLTVHLADEVELGGPVQYRWMYFIERLLRTLKNYVRNKAHPEGCIAEAYIEKECISFCSLYFNDAETKHGRPERNDDGGPVDTCPKFSIFAQRARALGAAKYERLSESDFEKIRWYVLHNCTEINEYLRMHKEELKKKIPIDDVAKRHESEFASWFMDHVLTMYEDGHLIGKEDPLYILGLGPDKRITRYSGIIVNGVRYHTKERDNCLVTQNSGVMVKGLRGSKEINFYGELTDIIELSYSNSNSIFIFKCDWWDIENKRNYSGLKVEGQLTSVNTKQKWYADDPFVLATQAELVFYVSDVKNGGDWRIVQKADCRSLYNIPLRGESDDNAESSIHNNEPYQQDQANDNDSRRGIDLVIDLNNYDLSRDDVLPESIDASSVELRQTDDPEEDDSNDDEDDTLDQDDDDDDDDDNDDR